jgi:hypothetical protein
MNYPMPCRFLGHKLAEGKIASAQRQLRASEIADA